MLRQAGAHHWFHRVQNHPRPPCHLFFRCSRQEISHRWSGYWLPASQCCPVRFCLLDTGWNLLWKSHVPEHNKDDYAATWEKRIFARNFLKKHNILSLFILNIVVKTDLKWRRECSAVARQDGRWGTRAQQPKKAAWRSGRHRLVFPHQPHAQIEEYLPRGLWVKIK